MTLTRRVCRCDCHTHTRFSSDSAEEMDAFCRRAVALGLDAVCFTEHLDFKGDDPGYYDADRFFEVFERVRAQYKEKLLVLAGIEVSQPHRHTEAFEQARRRPYDFILGSVHDFFPEELFMTQMVAKGYSAAEIFGYYWDEMLEMVRCGGFDAVAHFDFPKRYLNGALIYEPAQIDCICAEIVRQGMVLEINSSSLRKGCAEAMPGEALQQRYVAAGGQRITVGSDAHSAAELYADLPGARRKAEALGLRAGCFVARRWVAVGKDEAGRDADAE